jgi:hypothetical protein
MSPLFRTTNRLSRLWLPLLLCLPLFYAALLMAQAPPSSPSAAPAPAPAKAPEPTPAWQIKVPARWSEDDAKELLGKSPWVKVISAGLSRRETEDELRQGGQMGQPEGPGYDHVDPKGSGYRPQLSGLFTGKGRDDRSIRSRPGTIPIGLRWESALPIRMAELRAGQDQLAVDADGYQIGVFGVPTPDKLKDPEKWDGLKDDASLRRDGKTNVKPAKVEVFQREDGLVIIYVFPLSAELTKKDGRVQFVAQIGRIVVNEYFDLTEMNFQGKLAL